MTGIESSTTELESQVREIASLVSKAAKNYQVYLPNNRIFLSSLAEAKLALDRFLEENDVLTLVVKEFELLLETVPVYSNQDKHQSLAFRMYRDGVRLISFHRGISEEELVAFFEALTRCLESENLEEDFVTILWEKDLQSITYYEVNDYDTDYEKRSSAGARNIDPEFQPLGPVGDVVEWTEVTRDAETLMPALELTTTDLEEVKGLAFVVEDDLFIKRAWQVLVSTLDLAGSDEVYLDLENAVIGFLDVCVAMKQLGSAAEVLSEVAARFRARGGEDVTAALSRIMQSRHSEANMKVIGELLAGEREAEHDQCLAYLSQLAPGALRGVVELVPRCTHQSARQVIVMSLASIGRDAPSEIVKCSDCESGDETEVVLDALAALGTEGALGCAMDFHTNPSPKIRVKVASLAGRLKNGAALKVTQALLQDANPSVRRTALGSLVEIDCQECVQILSDLFTSKDFNLLARDRKTSMLLALRKLSPENQTAIVGAIFKMRGWRLRRSLEETKGAFIDILHLMHPDVVDYFEDQLLERVPGQLRRAAETAIKKVKRDDRMR